MEPTCPACAAGAGDADLADIDWVAHVMGAREEDAFAILRPTSPFRTAATIRRAWEQFVELGDPGRLLARGRAREGSTRGRCG